MYSWQLARGWPFLMTISHLSQALAEPEEVIGELGLLVWWSSKTFLQLGKGVVIFYTFWPLSFDTSALR